MTSAPLIKVYDPGNLPLRTHGCFMKQAHKVQFAQTEAEANALSRTYGIKGISALSTLSSLSFPHSFPYDFMHLIWENMMKNMVLLWSGAYKGLDAGSGDYILPAPVWEEIGRIGAESGATIPSCFGPCPPNIASDKLSWTADSRSFWALFVGPTVLKDRFPDRRYYNHFVAFVRLVETCLQFEMPVSDVPTIRAGFIDWVQTYEELYYQYAPSRISTCPLTVHALLHIADSIVVAGPVWASWAFPMERYCGSLQPAFKSRCFPFSALNRYILDRVCLSHICMLYASTIGDPEKLLLRAPALEGYFGGLCIRHYENCALLPSHRICNFGQGIINKIVEALCTRFSAPPAAVRGALSCSIHEWERFRFLPEGDIVSAAAYHSRIDAAAVVSPNSRDNTFVRYKQIIDLNARFRNLPPRWEQRPFFNQLVHLIMVDTTTIPSPFNIPPTTVLFAIIQTCNITSKHATLDIHYYSDVGPLEVVDMTTVQCIVGHVRDRWKWGIVDRSGHLNRVIYIEEE